MNNRNLELEHSYFSQLFSRGFCIHHAGLEHHWINLQGGLFHYGFPADRMENISNPLTTRSILSV